MKTNKQLLLSISALFIILSSIQALSGEDKPISFKNDETHAIAHMHYTKSDEAITLSKAFLTRKPFDDSFGTNGYIFIRSFFDHNARSTGVDRFDGEYFSIEINGISWYNNHAGIDYGTGTDPIYAAHDGKISFYGKQTYTCNNETVCDGKDSCTVSGNMVKIKKLNTEYETTYVHLSSLLKDPDDSTKYYWKVGDKVQAGDRLGYSGTTGCSTGNHLHFSINENTDPFGKWGDAGNIKESFWVSSNNVNTDSVGFQLFNDKGFLWRKVDNTGPNTGSKANPVRLKAFYTQAASSASYYDSNLKWDNWAFWIGHLPSEGKYRVKVYIPDYAPKDSEGNDIHITEEANYRVYYKDGIDDVSVNQSNNLGKWVVLGKYTFNAGSRSAVRLIDQIADESNKSKVIWASAVKWENIADGPVPDKMIIFYSKEGVDILEEPLENSIPKCDASYTFNKKGIVLRGPVSEEIDGQVLDWYKIYWGTDEKGDDIIGWSVNMGVEYLQEVSNVPSYAHNVGKFSEDFKRMEINYKSAFLKRFFDEYIENGFIKIGQPIILVEYVGDSNSGIYIQPFIQQDMNSTHYGDHGLTAMILNIDKNEVFLIKDKIFDEYMDDKKGSILLHSPIEEQQENDKSIVQNFERGAIIFYKEKLKTSIDYNRFSDTKNHWARKYINYVARHEVINGYSDDTFAPQKSVTRAELVKMCYKGVFDTNALKEILDNQDLPDPGFSDVDSGHWVYKYIAHAKKYGYIHGNAGFFFPDDPVDRYEAAKIIYNIFGAEDSDIKIPIGERLTFPDVTSNIRDWDDKYVDWISNITVSWEDDDRGVRIASGFRNGKFGEDDYGNILNINRAEMSKIIANCMNLKKTGSIYLYETSDVSMRKIGSYSSNYSNAITLGFSYEQIYDDKNVTPPEPVQYMNMTILETETISYNGDKIDSDGDEMFYFWNTTGGSFSTTDNENYSCMTWIPPNVSEETTFIIRVERGDGRGKINFGMFEVKVLPVKELDISSTEEKIAPSDGVYRDCFGRSVSISGDYAIVGAYGVGLYGESPGSAYIFKRDGHNWIEQTKLLASDGSKQDFFGGSVSISGDYAIVGAYGDDNADCFGSAYIFKRTGDAWIEQIKILPSDGINNSHFGNTVSISGDYAIVGDRYARYRGYQSGSAYIFRRDGDSWIEHIKLLPFDIGEWDEFGSSVSISGDYAIVGAIGANSDDSEISSGAAYIFKREGVTWVEQAKILASDGTKYDYFGSSVSISGEYIIVGAPQDDDNGESSGSAYIFKREGETWIEQTKLLAYDGKPKDYFGYYSVSISSDYALVGADGNDDNGISSGAAYIYKRDGGNWIEQEKLLASDGAEQDSFGSSVSISEDYAIVGAEFGFNKNSHSGSAYIYTLLITQNHLLIPGDANGDGKVDLKDLKFCQQILTGSSLSLFYLEAEDFNGNKKLDVGEQQTLLRMIQK
jgi:murein DD-endopeptidase MepM/ murein hydrolase activator NlpD